MPPTGAAVLKHPDKNEIVDMLSKGVSVKKVETWLKEKYPDDKSKHISWMTIQEFRKNYLKLYGDALEQVKIQSKKEEQIEKYSDNLDEVRSLPAYQKAVKNIAQNHIDLKERLLDIDNVIWQRIKDHIEEVKTNGEAIKRDTQLERWVSLAKSLLNDYARLIENKPDSVHQHNVNITVMNDYVSAIKESIREILVEIDPEKVPRFLELCDQKIKKLQLPSGEQKAKESIGKKV